MNTQPSQTNYYNPNQPVKANTELKLVPTSSSLTTSHMSAPLPTPPKLPTKTKSKLKYLLFFLLFVLAIAGTIAGLWLSNQSQEVRRQAVGEEPIAAEDSCSMILNVLPPQQCNEYCNTTADCPAIETSGNQIVYECFENKCRNLYNLSSETCEYLDCPCPTDLSAEYESNEERFFVNLNWSTPEPLAHWENYTPKYKIFRSAQQIESMYEGNSYQDDNDGAGFTSASLPELEWTVLIDETDDAAHCSVQGCSVVGIETLPSPTPTATQTPTPTPTSTPVPDAPTATPTPTSTPIPNAPTATPTATPTSTSTPAPTATPNPTLAASCNEPCTTNADCSNSQHICYSVSETNNVCRLGSNPTDSSCQPPRPTTPPTSTPRIVEQPTTQPPVPAALPETGPEDWLNYLKTGLAILGVSMALLLMLWSNYY